MSNDLVRTSTRAMNGLSRRQACLIIGATVCAGVTSPMASASAEPVRHHALSLIGEPKFKAGFKHFDWVNPDAPKGGILRQRAIGSFDTLNAFSAKGSPATGLSLLHATLMTSSLDESATDYCLVAEWVSMPDDFSSVTFKLRPEAQIGRAHV